MMNPKVKVLNKSGKELPKYESKNAAGLDVRAHLDSPIHILAGNTKLIPTGIFMEIPQGYECQVRPRSGLALKKGITVLNTPGTIDADYRGEVGVILINHSKETVTIADGDRVAQLVFNKIEQIIWEDETILSETQRGEGGFGSTGIK